MEWNQLFSTLTPEESASLAHIVSEHIFIEGRNGGRDRYGRRFSVASNMQGSAGSFLQGFSNTNWSSIQQMNLPMMLLKPTSNYRVRVSLGQWETGYIHPESMWGSSVFDNRNWMDHEYMHNVIQIGFYYVKQNIREMFEQKLPGLNADEYKSLPTVELGLKQDRHYRIKVFLQAHAETESYNICIFCNKPADFTLWRKLNAVLPALCPSFFQKVQAELGEELDLIDWYRSMAEETPDKLEAMLKAYAETHNIAAEIRQREITQAMERYQRQARDRFQRDERHAQENIENLESQLSGYYTQLRDTQLKLLGFDLGTNDEFQENINYWLAKQNLLMVIPHERDYSIRAWSPVNNYDAELVETLLKSKRSPFWHKEMDIARNKGINEHDPRFDNLCKGSNQYVQELRQVFNDIFLDCKYILFFENEVRVTERGPQTWHLEVPYTKGCPNPHLEQYNCYGNNAREITKALTNNDHIIVLEQTIQCIGSINFADGTVFHDWLTRIRQHDAKYWSTQCIETPDGSERYSFETLCQKIRKEWQDNETNSNAGQPDGDGNREVQRDTHELPV